MYLKYRLYKKEGAYRTLFSFTIKLDEDFRAPKFTFQKRYKLPHGIKLHIFQPGATCASDYEFKPYATIDCIPVRIVKGRYGLRKITLNELLGLDERFTTYLELIDEDDLRSIKMLMDKIYYDIRRKLALTITKAISFKEIKTETTIGEEE